MTRKAKITVAVIAVLILGTAGAAFVFSERPQKGRIVEVSDPEPSAPQTTDAPEVVDENVPEPESEAASNTAPDQPDTEQAEIDEEPEPVVPKFDVVRIDTDGSTVVAGQATPGATVEIVLDGDVIATETADGAGQFVSLFTVTVTGEPRQLILRAAGEEAETELEAIDVATGGADAEGQTAEDAEQVAAAPAPEPQSSEGTPSTEAVVQTQPEPDSSELSGQTETASVSQSVADPDPSPSVDQATETDLTSREPAQVAQDLTVATAPIEDTVQAQRDIATAGGAALESAPVLILPGASQGSAPTVVQPAESELALLQPANSGAADTTVRLDRISYSSGGEVDLLGRATPGNTVRIYTNAVLATEATVVPAGQWRASLDAATGQSAKLLRFDEVDPTGKVVSRIETPFSYEVDDGPKTLRQRTVEIERGDYLWRIAEQFYGEGLRYSLIFSANSELIKDPDLIYPGQVFTVPQLVDGE